MLDVLGEHGLKVVAAEDEHPVEAFAPDGADDALTDGVGPGCSDRAHPVEQGSLPMQCIGTAP